MFDMDEWHNSKGEEWPLDASAANSSAPHSPIACGTLQLVGVAYIVLLLAVVGCNMTVLWMLFSYKHLKLNMNMFVIALTVLNLIGAILHMPFVIISNLMCKWPFRQLGCAVSGFVMFLVGTASIYLMAVIAMERYWLVHKPLVVRHMTWRTRLHIIAACLLLAFVWSALPMFGWSRYSLEAFKTSCSIEWADRSLSVTSYNMTIFVGIFLIPLVLIVAFSTKLILTINRLCGRKRIARGTGSTIAMSPAAAQQQQEALAASKYQQQQLTSKTIKMTIIFIIYMLIFIIAWTPYALVSFYSALIVPNGVGPVYSLLPAICAKTSMLWSSLFFLASNYSFKHANAAAKSDKTLTSLKSSAYEMAAAAKNHTKCPLELRSSRA